ncbi:MAG TPA: hypothetical protein VGF77_06410 [Allosphingosinicella sp.]|jgi:hypothetical protein
MAPATAPRLVTHIYHAGRGPFRNLCELPDDEAHRILAEMRASGRPKLTPEYLARRRATEAWLLRQAEELFGKRPSCRPLYGFLGSFGHSSDPSRPRAIRFELASLGRVSFTLGDSMSVASRTDRRLLGRTALDALFAAGDVGRWDLTDAGRPARDFIEVQIWERAHLPLL